MAARPKEDMVIGKQGSLDGGGSNKRHKEKNAHHAFEWKMLDNPNVPAEMDWKDVKEEFWSSKMCKRYVKMYHVDKL
jgi:hypothetical protein